MSPRQEKYAPGDMVDAIEANLAGMMWVPGCLGRFSEQEPPGVKRSMVDFPYSFFNCIGDTRLAPSQVEAAIQFIISDAKARKVPVLWWIGPYTTPADLEQHLKNYGFLLHDDQPGMAVELAKLDAGLRNVPGLSIQKAHAEADWWQWGRTMSAGFELPPATEFVVKAWHDLFSRIDPEIVTAYTGFLDGQPVATSALALVGGAAGIYGVSTIPVARRKGVGAWMTLQPLLDARAKGYQVGVLQATEMGASVYRSLGFQEYCRICSYLFRP